MIVIYCKKWNTDIRLLIIIRIIKPSFFLSFFFLMSCFLHLSIPKRLYHCCRQFKEFGVNFCSLSVLGCVLHKKKWHIFFCTIVKPVANSTRNNCLSFVLPALTTTSSLHQVSGPVYCDCSKPPTGYQVCRDHWKLFNYFTLKEHSLLVSVFSYPAKNVSVKGERLESVFWHPFNLIIKMWDGHRDFLVL